MIVPALILLFSLLGVYAALTVQELSDLILLAGPIALASLFLLVRAYVLRDKNALQSQQNLIVIDGSNAMHWRDETPKIETLREVVHHLSALGFTPGVVLDANAGHLLTGKYQHNKAMGKLLGLPEDRVMVVSKGTPADPTILAAAKHLGARIVTNGRFRDWTDAHPELSEPGYLIRGGYREGKLWLDVDQSEK